MAAIEIPASVDTPLPMPDLTSVDTGTVADDGTGDTPYSAGNKINDNFTAILAALNQVAPQGWEIPSVQTLDYDATVGSFCIRMDATLGDLSVNLPAASAVEGHAIEIVKWDASANIITPIADGSDTLFMASGAGNLTTRYQSVRLRSVGNGWVKV